MSHVTPPAGLREFKALIYDMDGVIVDSEPRHQRAFMDVFRKMGYEHNHGVEFESYLGKSDCSVWVDFVAMHNPKWTLDELQAWKQSRFIEILRDEQPIFDGLPELVSKTAEVWPLAVASGSLHPVIDEVLALKNLRQYFKVVVSIGDVGKTKPAPDVFLRAAELLDISPADCCVIEDSAAGVQAALSAGMQVIAITNSLPAEQLSGATIIVSNYAEIEQLLLPLACAS